MGLSSTLVTVLVLVLAAQFALHSTWVTSVAYSSPSVVLASQVSLCTVVDDNAAEC